jgi:AraC-like DNA-binding protein
MENQKGGWGAMNAIEFNILPAPKSLKNEVECIRIARHVTGESFALKTSLNGLPGIVFQHHEGRSPVENIITRARCNSQIPILYLYGQITEPSIMNHHGPYTMTQVLLKPHALHTLLGLNASSMTNRLVELSEFSVDLNDQLLEADHQQKQIALLTDFLVTELRQARTRDKLIEESLSLIHKTSGSIRVRWLLDKLNISERHFERRFSQTVGVSPQFYIRVKRFNEAVRLMKARQFARLAEVAHSLNYYDESHFIHDVKAFSGMTPKKLSQKNDDFLHGQAGYFYM